MPQDGAEISKAINTPYDQKNHDKGRNDEVR